MKKMKEPITMATTVVESYKEMYDQYVEYCGLNEQKPAAYDSQEFMEWVGDEMNYGWEADMAFIDDNYGVDNGMYVLTGTLGLWNGCHDIEPKMFGTIHDAVTCCTEHAWDAKVVLDIDGSIKIYGYHHDGTNVFELHRVKSYCKNKCSKAFEDYENYQTDTVELKPGWFQRFRTAW